MADGRLVQVQSSPPPALFFLPVGRADEFDAQRYEGEMRLHLLLDFLQKHIHDKDALDSWV